MAGSILDESEIEALLASHPDWERDGDGLRRTFVFADFVTAFGFMTRVALISERLFHHPEWRNVYDRVEVRITDHDAGGISTTDRDWIERVDGLVG